MLHSYLSFLLLIPSVCLIIIYYQTINQKKNSSIHQALTKVLSIKPFNQKRLYRYNLLRAIIVSSFLILLTLSLTPLYFGQKKSQTFVNTAPVIIILDASWSMAAQDIAPSRFQMAQFKIKDLIDAHPERRYALITYSKIPFVITPITRDSQALLHLLNSLSVNIMPAHGSNLDQALELALTLGKRSDSLHYQLLFITDSLDQADFDLIQTRQAQEGFQWAALLLSQSPTPLMMLKTNSPLIAPAQDFDQLQSFPHSPKHLLIGFKDLNQSTLALSKHFSSSDSDQKSSEFYLDSHITYPLIMLSMLFFLLFFIRGFWFLIPLAFISAGHSVHLYALGKKDVRGYSYYQSQDFKNALDHFEDSYWKANAFFQTGDYINAIKHYQALLEENPDDLTLYYNLATALAYQLNLNEARYYYQAFFDQFSLLSMPSSETQALFQKAFHNDQLIQSFLEQNHDPSDDQSPEKDMPDTPPPESPKKSNSLPFPASEDESTSLEHTLRSMLNQINSNSAHLLKRQMQLEYEETSQQKSSTKPPHEPNDL